VLVVRHLSISDYGAFTIAVGSSILFGLICGVGIERLIPRYLSELQARGEISSLARLSWLLLLARIVFLLPAFAITYLSWDLICHIMRIELQHDYYWVLISYVAAFLVGKQCADTLQAILRNREAAFGSGADALVRLGVLGYFSWRDELSLVIALWAYIAGAAIGAAVCVSAMWRHFVYSSDKSKTKGIIEYPVLLRYSWHAYLHNLGGILLTPQALRMLCASLLGAVGIAALGFAQSLVEFVRRHLPVNFLTTLIEPIFIGRYRETKDFNLLNTFTSVILKINLFILAPFVCWTAISGYGILSLITAGKYLDSIWLLVVLLTLIAFESHRTLLHLIIMAVDETWLLVMSQFWPNVFLFLLLAGVYFFGLVGFVVCLGFISVFNNIYLIRNLRRRKYAYEVDWRNISKLCFLSLVGSGVGFIVSQNIEGWLGSLTAAVVTSVIFLVTTYITKAFSSAERDLINRLIGRPLWVW